MNETLTDADAPRTRTNDAETAPAETAAIAMSDERVCQNCGAGNLADALFCASCGLALSTEHLTHPGLAALVGDEGTPATDPPHPEGPPPTTAPVSPPSTESMAYPPHPEGPPPTTAPVSPPSTESMAYPAPPAAMPPSSELVGGRSSGSNDRPWLLPTTIVALVLVIAAAVLVGVSLTGDDDATPTGSPQTTETADGTAPATTLNPTGSTAPETTTPDTTVPDATTTIAPTTTVPVDALTQLTAIAASDLDRTLQFRERWVPQVSAKTEGTEWEGVTYDLPAILALHEQLDAQVGGALLVEGSTLAFLRDGERMAGWWFTLADIDFDEPDDALAWCADAGFDRTNCAARLVTDRDDATGTLRLQPA